MANMVASIIMQYGGGCWIFYFYSVLYCNWQYIVLHTKFSIWTFLF